MYSEFPCSWLMLLFLYSGTATMPSRPTIFTNTNYQHRPLSTRSPRSRTQSRLLTHILRFAHAFFCLSIMLVLVMCSSLNTLCFLKQRREGGSLWPRILKMFNNVLYLDERLSQQPNLPSSGRSATVSWFLSFTLIFHNFLRIQCTCSSLLQLDFPWIHIWLS